MNVDGTPISLPVFTVVTTAKTSTLTKTTRKRETGSKEQAPRELNAAQALDVDSLQAGDLVCSNCGAPWPGTFNGFWLSKNGDGPRQWYHWCTGGRPGVWHVAELAKGEGGDAR